jgi:hypothetical protein
VVLCLAGGVFAALPIRKPDAVDVVVEKVVPATGAEKKQGVVVTVFLKGRKAGIPVSKQTPIHIQMGKLVPFGKVDDLKPGSKVSIWVDARTRRAEGVLIFP